MIDIKEIELAEKEGRLIILPCAIGTTVYQICEDWCFACTPEQHISWVIPTEFELEMLPEIGESIFLNEQEAKDAAEKLGDFTEYNNGEDDI